MKRISLKLSIFSVLFVGFLLIATSSYAANPNRDSSIQSPLPSQAAARLEKGKLRACEARKEAIITRSQRLTNLATTMQEKFDIIALRVQDYYTTTLVPEGKTVSNYDTLTSEMQTKKSLVTSSLANAQANLSEFSCESGNPKATVQQFNEDMRMVKGALKEYRTAIKNLIVAVRGNNL